MLRTDFSRRITLLRKEKGYSQKYVASELGISQALLSHYEKGIRECGLNFLINCAEFYGVSCDYLLGISPERSGNTIKVEEIEEIDSLGKENMGKSMLPILHKKLIINSITILYDVLAATKNKTIITEASNYLMTSIYRIFRILYGANAKNEQNMFAIDKAVTNQKALVSMIESDALMVASVNDSDYAGAEKLDNENKMFLSTEEIQNKYPMQSTSLFNLVQSVENKMK